MKQLLLIAYSLTVGLSGASLAIAGACIAEDFQACKKEATEGNANAQHILGRMYANGKGVTQNYKEAAKWSKKAANQGNADAQYNLGLLYANGLVEGFIKTFTYNR